ncbi:MAG: alkaline phosphatase family protein [Kiritimatiellae bacterium]|nr:alkaline phosphatase family protein [Kiritimatiellia bacterium]
MQDKTRVFVFIDALGWKQAERYGFLKDLLPCRKAVEMQFGYSCTAIPTILTGERPAVHGHLAFYDWAPGRSPFRAMRFLAPFLKPRSFWRRGRVRNVLSRIVKRLCGFTGYFQLYGVPIERLPKLDYCEKKNLFVRGGLSPVKNLADVWSAQGKRHLISDWRRSEAENFREAAEAFRKGSVDRAFVYSAAFDALQHDNVGKDAVLKPKVDAYAETVRNLHRALEEGGRPFELTVFSDHGMTPLRGTADIPSALDGASLVWGEDYASAIDSTMARFWWLKPVEAKVKELLKGFPGRWLSEDEMRRHGIWRDDRKFGDAIFLADPGVQFCPGDMGAKPLNGMHGFDPCDEDSLACWLSTVPVPDSVSRVCDYFKVMTA